MYRRRRWEKTTDLNYALKVMHFFNSKMAIYTGCIANIITLFTALVRGGEFASNAAGKPVYF